MKKISEFATLVPPKIQSNFKYPFRSEEAESRGILLLLLLQLEERDGDAAGGAPEQGAQDARPRQRRVQDQVGHRRRHGQGHQGRARQAAAAAEGTENHGILIRDLRSLDLEKRSRIDKLS